MRLYVAFISKPQWEAGWPFLGYDNEAAREEILAVLKRELPEVEFVGGTILTGYDPQLLKRMAGEIRAADGLVLCLIGHFGDPGLVKAGLELLSLGKPAILASRTYGGDHVFIQLYEQARRRGFRVLPIASPRLEDFAKAVRVLATVLRLRGRRILLVATDCVEVGEEELRRLRQLLEPELKAAKEARREFLEKLASMIPSIAVRGFYVDLRGLDQAHQWRRDVEGYMRRLKEVFGVEVVRIEPEELCDLYEQVGEGEARDVVEAWTMRAQEVNVPYETLLNSARLYLALKRLLREKSCDAVTVDCGTLLLTGRLPAFPCMAFFQLLSEGIPACCESDLDSTITLMLGMELTGKPGFVSNYAVDTVKGRLIYLHCMACSRLAGEELPLAIEPHGEAHLLGASPVVRFPEGVPVTTAKVSVLKGKLALRLATSLGYEEVEEACRNKLVVKANVERILDLSDWETFGWHRVSFLGDYVWEFKAAAKLLGLEVVEEDLPS